MKEELLKFEEWPVIEPNIEEITKSIHEITEEFKAAKTKEEAYEIVLKMFDLTDKINDNFTHIQVLFTLDTRNEKISKINDLIDEGSPVVGLESQNFQKELLKSEFRPYLEEKFGKFMFEMIEFEMKSFDERVLEEAQKENMLVSKYGQITASYLIEYEGEKYSLAGFAKFLQQNDREKRIEASNIFYSFMDEHVEELEQIYDELVKVRDQMAHKLGFKNYIELGYYRMQRFDYTPKMVSSYRNQIADYVTPAANKLVEKQFERLGIEHPTIFDLPVKYKEGNATPKGTTEEKVNNAKVMYNKLSPDTDYFFNFLNDHHLLFLDAKPGKQGGGYMTYFPVHKCPIIFSNFNGTSHDVDVLTHEFGHAFQSYVARDIKNPFYRAPTMESCEIHSMSMEFFAEPYMDLFFDNSDRYRHSHLADAIEFLPYGVTVDEFQHWVYENPNATPAERDVEWRRLEEKFTPWKVELAKDCKYLREGHRWLLQSHIFQVPFYYIDYTLAQVCAFQFFNLDREDHEKAWNMYMDYCALGGKYPFCELITNAGLKNPFNEGVLKETITPLMEVLETYKI